MVQKPADELESYGLWKVVYTTERGGFGGGTRNIWYVQYGSKPDENERIEFGVGKEKKRLARTLAATMNAAGADLALLPPEIGPMRYADDEWEAWSGRSNAVPTKVAAAGKAAIAGYCKVVHREREGWIAGRLDVSEQTVRQYLSDLREGRR